MLLSTRRHVIRLALPLAILTFGTTPLQRALAASAAGAMGADQATIDFYNKITARDLEGVSRYLPPEGFTEFPVGGGALIKLDRKAFDGFLKSDTEINLRATDVSVENHGTTAIVTGLRVGSITPRGQAVTVHRHALTMVWVNTPAGWILRHVHVSAIAPTAAPK